MRKDPKDYFTAQPLADVSAKYETYVVRRGHDDCWDWRGAKSKGYGIATIAGRNARAHRISYFLHYGHLPQDAIILHLCHNPSCTNPKHLVPGTHKANSESSQIAGRLQRHIPLNELNSVKEMRDNGLSLAEIGRRFGCTKQAVRHMMRTRNIDDSHGRKRDPHTLITYNGETRPLREWASLLGISYATLRFRYVRRGWSAEKSLTHPIMRGAKESRKVLKPAP